MKDDHSLAQVEKTDQAGVPSWNKKIQANSAGGQAQALDHSPLHLELGFL